MMKFDIFSQAINIMNIRKQLANRSGFWSRHMGNIKRDIYLNKLINSRENGKTKIVSGMRRSGKSHLLFILYFENLLSTGVDAENIIRLSLEDPSHIDLRNPDNIYRYINARLQNNDRMHYVFLDEVWHAIGNEDVKGGKGMPLYGLFDKLMALGNADLYVTTSNSKYLTKDVKDEFKDRTEEIRVYPLSFSEYYDFVRGSKWDAYEEYALHGGLPLILSKTTAAEKEKYLDELFKEVYFTDISERYSFSHPEVMEGLMEVLTSLGCLTDSSKISSVLRSEKGIKADEETVSSYLDCLEDSFL